MNQSLQVLSPFHPDASRDPSVSSTWSKASQADLEGDSEGPLLGTLPAVSDPLQALGPMYEAIRHPFVTALISPCTEELEPGIANVFAQEVGKPCLMAGIQFPESIWKGSKPSAPVGDDDSNVVSFLDRMEKKHGQKSVYYFR